MVAEKLKKYELHTKKITRLTDEACISRNKSPFIWAFILTKNKAMSFKITSYSGFFYVIDKSTGKLLIEQSFKSYDEAKREAKRWAEYLAK